MFANCSCAKHILIESVSYNIFAINIASVMIGYVYGSGGPYFAYDNSLPRSLSPLHAATPPLALTTKQDLCLKVATPVGSFIGQLVFGGLADVYGRRRMCESQEHRQV